jgi:D-arabinose 1-dehydrogenase-like Zn-dependent alcohol dehydrogenase
MKAWQYTGDGKPISLNEIDEPTAAPGQVVLDVKGAGICHSDIGMLDGTISEFLAANPITLGHEVAGVIREVGEGVSDFSVGDRVAVRSVVEGPGVGCNGGFQPRLAVRTSELVRVPEGVAWDQAAVSTDAGMTSYHAVITKAGTQAGDKIGLIGFGGLGSLGAVTALRAGAEIYVAEINESLHPAILAAGAKAVSTSITGFAEVSLDAIVDFAGFGTTTAEAVATVRHSGRVVQVGLAVREGTIDLVDLTMREIELVGSQGGTNEGNAAVLQMMADGDLVSDTECISFDEIGDAIGRLERGENTGRFAVVYD